jgi:hypothetical protein
VEVKGADLVDAKIIDEASFRDNFLDGNRSLNDDDPPESFPKFFGTPTTNIFRQTPIVDCENILSKIADCDHFIWQLDCEPRRERDENYS